ncbi:MAG: FliH/SctL family protein [Novosphingobium sp.]
MSEPARVDFAALPVSGGFRLDTRFTLVEAPLLPEPEPEPAREDPCVVAYADGYAAGMVRARQEAEERERIEAASRDALALSIARLDRDMEEELRQRLRDTVAALCEAAIAPLALDQTALKERIERAASMLARIDDERVIRLHPDDLALVAPRLAEDWDVQPDASLARGAIRVEARSGGVEDGPEQWRMAIAEALARC